MHVCVCYSEAYVWRTHNKRYEGKLEIFKGKCRIKLGLEKRDEQKMIGGSLERPLCQKTDRS